MIRLAIILMLLPGAALACACCAERGERFEYRLAVDEYLRGELSDVRTSGAAHLFLTACGEDCVKGIKDPQERYPVEVSIDAKDIVFVFEKSGVIRMKLPENYTYFGVDTNPATERYTGSLYTEMRFAGPVQGMFDFASGAQAELVIGGQGNMCVGAHNFEHWTLTVTGEDADYRLFGGLQLR